MTSVGELLHCERISQGRELAEIAEELCITQRYLRAIEQDDLKSLPGSFFYKSFVKQYAKLLGLDSATVEVAIADATAEERVVPATGSPRPLTGLGLKDQPAVPPAVQEKIVRGLDPIVAASNRRYFGDRRLGLSLTALVAVLLGCSVFYGWWNRAPKPVARLKQAIETPAPAPILPLTSEAGIKMSTDTPAASSASAMVPVSDANDVNQVVLSLNATEKTWLSITSDGKVIFSGILEPSETKILHGHEEAKLKVGNAGGLEVRFNGKPIGPIGPRGQVRVIKFTPDNFQILSPSTTL